jgi:hypothetical protein
MTYTAQTMVAMALLKLIGDDTNRAQLTRFLGFAVEPSLPPHLTKLLKRLD